MFDRMRSCWLLSCDLCGKKFYRPIHLVEKRPHRHFCSSSCQGLSKRKRRTYRCNLCSKKFERTPLKIKSKSGFYFCSRRCKDFAQTIEAGFKQMHPKHYGEQSTCYRDVAFKFYGHRCSHCGYKKSTRMLDVHHIDKNRKNNHKENLIVLCVWCHALVTRGLVVIINRKLVTLAKLIQINRKKR